MKHLFCKIIVYKDFFVFTSKVSLVILGLIISFDSRSSALQAPLNLKNEQKSRNPKQIRQDQVFAAGVVRIYNKCLAQAGSDNEKRQECQDYVDSYKIILAGHGFIFKE